jgi:hypothetical protein
LRFVVTMHMPSSSGNLVHQMIVSHASNSLEEFVATLSNNDFIIVEEYYRRETGYESRGKIAVSYRHIGKIKIANGEM